MNARQKAKHFKRLYEESLSKKPYPVKYTAILPKHYKITQLISAREIVYLQHRPSLLKAHIENKILHDLKPLIWDHFKIEKDPYSGEYRYWLDIWVES